MTGSLTTFDPPLHFRFLLLVVIFCLPSLAYSQISNDIFEKKWRLVLDLQQKLSKMPAEERKAYDKLTAEQKKRIEEDLTMEIEKSAFTFNTNNSFYVEFEGKRTYEGSWRISDDGRSVILQSKEGVSERIYIKKIEPERVVVVNAAQQQAPDIILIPTGK
jgi:hypothetical protein